MALQTVGVVGTGIMGAPMAVNLLKAGYPVIVYNRTKAKTEPLRQAGAEVAETPADLAKQTELIISCVSDSPDVEAVYLGPEGICETLRPNTLCIDMSTISPETAEQVATEVQQRGGRFLDAPVSGGKTGAEAGTLSIMLGGDAQDLQRAKPVLEVVGKSIVHCGPIGNGQRTKLCNQILCGLNLLAVSEAIVFAKQVGLDPSTMLEAVAGGAAGSWAVNNLGTRMVSRDFAPMFMIDLQQKDLKITLNTAREHKVPLPGTALVTQLLESNQAAGEGSEGTQALVKTIERLAAC